MYPMREMITWADDILINLRFGAKMRNTDSHLLIPLVNGVVNVKNDREHHKGS